MLEQDFYIAALIAKSVTNSLSEKEAQELERWKNASEHNLRLFESMCRKENLYAHFRRAEKYDKAVGWEQVQKRIRVTRRKKLYLAICQYAAIFLLPLAAGILTWHFTRDEGRTFPEPVLAETMHITPGESKAVLTLGDGTVVGLDAESRDELKESGIQINVNDAELAYNKKETDVVAKEEVVYNKMDIPRGGEYKLRLSDGSLVHLNAMSSLRYPVHFSGDSREVELTGEAFFEVSKSRSPFIVKTKGIDVRVLGTMFNVSAYPDDHCIQTTLVTGSVRIHTKEGGSIDLKPSQQAELDNESHELVVRQVDVSLYTSWIHGKIYFKDERLEDIMTALSRWYDVNVIYGNENVKNLRFGCNLNRYEEIDPFLELLRATGKVKTKVEKRNITIY